MLITFEHAVIVVAYVTVKQYDLCIIFSKGLFFQILFRLGCFLEIKESVLQFAWSSKSSSTISFCWYEAWSFLKFLILTSTISTTENIL